MLPVPEVLRALSNGYIVIIHTGVWCRCLFHKRPNILIIYLEEQICALLTQQQADEDAHDYLYIFESVIEQLKGDNLWFLCGNSVPDTKV